MMDIGNAFPRLSRDVSIHLTPEGATAIEDGLPGSRDLPFETEYNYDAAQILSRCDGRTSLIDILRDLTNGTPQLRPQGITDFLKALLTKGVIEIHSEPAHVLHRQYGSFTYYVPTHASLELTDACNLSCGHCYRDCSTKSKGVLTTQEWFEVVETLSDSGIRAFELTGGEPTLHPGFTAILRKVCSVAQLVSVITNGTRLTNAVADALGECPNAIVQVDVDGTSQEHDSLRGIKGAYEKAIDGIKRLNKRNIRFRVAMNVYSDNLASLEKVASLASDLGATWFSASIILDVGRGRQLNVLRGHEIKEFIERLRKLQRSYPDGFVFTGEELIRRCREMEKNCGAGWRTIVVGPRGDVRPCPMFPEGLCDLGNVLRRSFTSICNQPRAASLRDLAAPSRETCGDCAMFHFCTGCLVRPFFARQALAEKQTTAAFPCRWDDRFSVLSAW